MKNLIKNAFNKIDVPQEHLDIIFKDVIRKVEMVRHGEKENTFMKNKLKLAIAGVGITAACIALVVFAAILFKTPMEIPEVAINSPESTKKLGDYSEYEIPDKCLPYKHSTVIVVLTAFS